jgi:hypothetical protein
MEKINNNKQPWIATKFFKISRNDERQNDKDRTTKTETKTNNGGGECRHCEPARVWQSMKKINNNKQPWIATKFFKISRNDERQNDKDRNKDKQRRWRVPSLRTR